MQSFTVTLVVNAKVNNGHISADAINAMLAHRAQEAMRYDLVFEDMDVPLDLVSCQVACDAANPTPAQALPVSAKVCSDDNKASASFDSSKWFQQASDDEIMTLGCGAEWGASDIADDIAHFYAEFNADVAKVFLYLEKMSDNRKPCSFECHVDPVSAMAWLKQHRPHLFRLLRDDD